MTRLTYKQRFLLNLEQKISPKISAYMTRDDAYQALKEITGEDFGYDVEKWRKWLRENGLDSERLLQWMLNRRRKSEP